MRLNPATGKQIRGFALLNPAIRRAIQAKGGAGRRASAVSKFVITREKLHALHWHKGLSLSQIGGLYDVCAQTVLNRMRKLKVQRRNTVAATALRRLDPEISRIAADARRGKKNPHWKGGRTSLYQRIRGLKETKSWREAVFKRDDYTCQNEKCAKRGGDLHADHIYAFAKIVLEERLRTASQAVACVRLWDVDNGRTLCAACHRATPSFGKSVSS